MHRHLTVILMLLPAMAAADHVVIENKVVPREAITVEVASLQGETVFKIMVLRALYRLSCPGVLMPGEEGEVMGAIRDHLNEATEVRILPVVEAILGGCTWWRAQ